MKTSKWEPVWECRSSLRRTSQTGKFLIRFCDFGAAKGKRPGTAHHARGKTSGCRAIPGPGSGQDVRCGMKIRATALVRPTKLISTSRAVLVRKAINTA